MKYNVEKSHLNVLHGTDSGKYKEKPLNVESFRSWDTFCWNEKRIQNENLRAEHSTAQVFGTANSTLSSLLTKYLWVYFTFTTSSNIFPYLYISLPYQ